MGICGDQKNIFEGDFLEFVQNIWLSGGLVGAKMALKSWFLGKISALKQCLKVLKVILS